MIPSELYEAFEHFKHDPEHIDYAYSALVNMWRDHKDDDVYTLIYNYRLELQKMMRSGEYDFNVLENAVHYLYILTAREKFDDFMIAIEWNREPQERFWLPRRKQLMKICQYLQALEDDKLDELFISQPPRTGKTTLVQFFTLWVMLRHPEKANLYVSFSGGVTKAYYEGVLEILNDPYTYDWQSVFPERSIASTNALETLLNIDRRKKYATLTCRSIDGTLNGACDCNGYAIADDLHEGIEEALSPDRLNKKWGTVENNYISRWKSGCKRLWIGTRWSVADCISHRIEFIQSDPKCKNIRFAIVNVPALNKDDESNFNYLYGVGFTSNDYQQRRASFERNNDMASWEAQYMGSPIERGGTVFLPDDMRYFNGTLPSEVEPDKVFMAVDPAWGGGDYVAAPICYMYGDGNGGGDIYVVDVVYNNSEKKITQPLICQKAKQWGVQFISIEATKTTSAYVEGISERLKEDGYPCSVTSNTKTFTGEGKAQRIFNHAPDIREYMLFLDGERSKEYDQFMANVYSFKLVGKNKHDDAPDSLAMAVEYALNRQQRNVVRVARRVF